MQTAALKEVVPSGGEVNWNVGIFVIRYLGIVSISLPVIVMTVMVGVILEPLLISRQRLKGSDIGAVRIGHHPCGEILMCSTLQGAADCRISASFIA